MTDASGANERGVIVDRDGTLIDFHRDTDLGVVTPAFHPSQVRLLPGVTAGLTLLQRAGYCIAIATNQPDAAKGRVTRQAIEQTNRALLSALAEAGITVAALRVCLHHPDGGAGGDPELIGPCDCRKPAPGMLLDIVTELGLDRKLSWMIGDTAHDLGAAHAAGLRCGLLMPHQRCELCQLVDVPLGGLQPAARAPQLDELARVIVAAS